MTRTGKIARLPAAIRDQLNRRLLDNEPGPALLDWLNALPEVKALLDAEFNGVPISAPNLSQWKSGGFRDWLTLQDALHLAHDLDDQQALGDDALAGPFADKLGRWLALHYAAVVVRAFAAEDLDPDTHWRRLRQLCADVTRLQREDHHAQRLTLERDRLELACSNAEWQRKQDLHAAKLRVLNLQRLHDLLPNPDHPSAPAPDSKPSTLNHQPSTPPPAPPSPPAEPETSHADTPTDKPPTLDFPA